MYRKRIVKSCTPQHDENIQNYDKRRNQISKRNGLNFHVTQYNSTFPMSFVESHSGSTVACGNWTQFVMRK